MPQRTDLSILFWTKVSRPGPGSCWDWLGAKTKDGHGVMAVWFEEEQRWRTKPASHVAVFLVHGFWPQRQLRRTCANVGCVNTRHLKLD